MALLAVPPELISAIFASMLAQVEYSPPASANSLDPSLWPSFDMIDPVLNLRLVCRLWNEIAEGTPELWNRIVLPAQLPSIAKRLTRSCELLVEVTVWMPTRRDGDRLPRKSLWWDIISIAIRNNIHRIRSLRLWVPERVASGILSRVAAKKRSAPVLEDFTLVFTSDSHTSDKRVLDAIVSDASRLRSVTVPSSFLPSPASVLLRNMTALAIISYPRNMFLEMRGLLDVLAAHPQLQSFTFSGGTLVSWSKVAPQVEILLPSLLTLDVTAPGCGFECIPHLRMPALTILRLDDSRLSSLDVEEEEEAADHEWVWSDEDHGATPVSLTLLSLASILSNLELVNMRYLQPRTYALILGGDMFPLLQTLIIRNCPLDDAIIESSTLANSASLERLELYGCLEVSALSLRGWLARALHAGDVSDAQSRPRVILIVRGCPRVQQEDLVG